MKNYKEMSELVIKKLPISIINNCKEIIKSGQNKIPHRPSNRFNENLNNDFSNRLDVPLPIAVKQCDNLKPCFFRLHLPPQELKDWCATYAPFIQSNRIWLTHVGGGDFLVPHVDLDSNIKLNFYLDDVCGLNTWYKPKKEYEHLIKNEKYEKDGQHLFSRLDVIDEICLKKHTWYAFRSGIPHGVIKVTTDRMFVALGSDNEMFLQ